MPWFVAAAVVALLAGLAALFFIHARAIRRDVEERFARFQVRLEDEANAVMHDLLNRHKRT